MAASGVNHDHRRRGRQTRPEGAFIRLSAMSDAAAEAPIDRFARSWAAYALIGLIALSSALFGAAAMPVMDRDEARFAQASRQMVETGDYVRIRVQNQERSKKPVGIHWLQAVSVRVFEPLTHRLNVIWPYRVPSALSAMLAALAAFWGGARLIGPRAALLGGALFAAGVLLGLEGMTAKTDAVLAGFTTLAMAALAHLYAGGARTRALALTFWIAMGCGILIKGPITPFVAALALIAIGLWEGRWRWMKPLAWWPGPLLATLIVAPWMIAIYVATNGDFFLDMVRHDLAPKITGGQEGHFAWPGYYLLLLPLMIFPATLALPAAFRLIWRTARAPRNDADFSGLRFLIAWALPAFLVFELAPTKLPHYPLPLYPAIALVCGAALVAIFRERWKLTYGLGLALFALAGAVFAALLGQGMLFATPSPSHDLANAAPALIAGGAVLLAALIALVCLHTPAQRVAVALTCALLMSFFLRQIIAPNAQTIAISARTTAALTRANLLDRPLWVVGYGEASIVFMTRTDIHIAAPTQAGQGANPGDAAVIEEAKLTRTQAALGARALVFIPLNEVDGANVGNGQNLHLLIGSIASTGRRQ
jgi:4-amino-4-deoxy-L-arabinose transferase-like glycosyltransferase